MSWELCSCECIVFEHHICPHALAFLLAEHGKHKRNSTNTNIEHLQQLRAAGRSKWQRGVLGRSDECRHHAVLHDVLRSRCISKLRRSSCAANRYTTATHSSNAECTRYDFARMRHMAAVSSQNIAQYRATMHNRATLPKSSAPSKIMHAQSTNAQSKRIAVARGASDMVSSNCVLGGASRHP